MEPAAQYYRDLTRGTRAGWNRFWFTPADPATLGLIRIAAGVMIFYTHLVWGLDLEGLLGPEARLGPRLVTEGIFGLSHTWSHFYWIDSMPVLWGLHVVALVVMAMFTLGLASRSTSTLTFLITVSYAHRAQGMLFGLDQMNAMLAMYLMLGPCGAAYSLDNLLRRRRGIVGQAKPSVGANLAVRLIQLHMCLIYLSAGLGKLLGPDWWSGAAIWNALAIYEYQPTMPPIDLSAWAADSLWAIELTTHIALFWEISFCVLIWPRLTRPLVLGLAIAVHLGIALCMAMMTFGLVMLIGNLAFVSPALVRAVVERRRTGGG